MARTESTDFGARCPTHGRWRRATSGTTATGRAALGLLLGLALLAAPGISHAQGRIPTTPTDAILALIDSLSDRLDTIQDDVDAIKASDLTQVTNFLGFRSCVDSYATLGGGIHLDLLPMIDGDVHGGVTVFGTGIAAKLRARLEGKGSIATGGGSALNTTVCVDWLKLAAFIDNQVSSARVSVDEAERLAALPVGAALSAGALDDLDDLLGELPEPTVVAEDLLALVGGFAGSLNPSGVVEAGGAVANVAIGLGPELFANPEDAFAISEVIPLAAGARDEMRDLGNLPARFANLDPCSFPIATDLLGTDCELTPPVDPDQLFAIFGGLSGLPAIVADLEGAVAQLQTTAGQIETTVGGVGTTLASIEGEIDGIGSAITGVGTTVGAIDVAVADVASSVQSLETSVGGLQSNLQTANGFASGLLQPTLAIIQQSLGAASAAFIDTRNGLAFVSTTIANLRNALETPLAAIESGLDAATGAANDVYDDILAFVTTVQNLLRKASHALDLIP